MKKVLLLPLLTLTLLLTSGSLYSKSSNSDRQLQIIDGTTKQVVGVMSVREFDILVKSSEAYATLLKSEEGKRLKLQVQDPIILVEDLANPVTVELIWFDENKAPIKTVRIDLTLPIKIDSPDSHWLRRGYRNFAEFGLPIATIVILILAL